jgi:methionyl-tRNA formyltransferase
VKLRAGFMGSPEFAVPSLHVTARHCELCVVVTQPDRPAGRGQRMAAPPVKHAAEALGVPVLQPVGVRDGALETQLRARNLDVLVVVAYGRILPPAVLAVPRHGCINVHGSVLPRWRGAAPIQRAILAGDPCTGISIMAMDAGCDTGPVYCTREVAIEAFETAGELSARLARVGGELLDGFLGAFPQVDPPRAQDDRFATVAAKLERSESPVDLGADRRRIVDHVRGMDPWPAATTTFEGLGLKLYGARPGPDDGPGKPGEILGADARGLLVRCGDGVVAFGEVQPAGGRRMPGHAFATGRRIVAGMRLGS